MIQAVGLTKQYGAKTAVYNLSFQVRPGTVTGFLGPNGSGKSTTMRMILGLDAPTAGQVTIGGLPYRRLPNAPRRVGALLDAKAVHGGRSARQHLLCLAQLSGIPARRVDEVLGVVGLQDVAGRRSKGFSLGMGQRLGIAGALLGDPEVLLFDEPVNGLDPEGIHWVRNLMRKLASEGRTVFVSSHLMSEMALTADHLVVIGRGQLLADMSVKDFIARNSTGYALVRTPADDRAAREADGGAGRGGRRRTARAGRRAAGHRPRTAADQRHRPRRRRPAVGAVPAPGVAGGGVHAPDQRRGGLPLRPGPAAGPPAAGRTRRRGAPQQGWGQPPQPGWGGQPAAAAAAVRSPAGVRRRRRCRPSPPRRRQPHPWPRPPAPPPPT